MSAEKAPAPLNIVLVEPQIPQNTGNIARTCAVTGAALHLVKPMGFVIDDKKLRRAGLDYWRRLDVRYYVDIDDFYAKNPGADCLYFTTKGGRCYTDADFSTGTFPYPQLAMYQKEWKEYSGKISELFEGGRLE